MEVLTERGWYRQVDRAFRDAILISPLIQHKIDLYAAGFEHNPASGIDLAESRRALHQYLSNLNSLCPVEKRSVENLRLQNVGDILKASGGVIATVNESVRLFTLGSSSRRIPHKEWEIPFQTFAVEDYCFYPCADVIAFIELKEEMCVHLLIIEVVAAGSLSCGSHVHIDIHLRTLSSGGFHPAARRPMISYSQRGISASKISSASISSSRLAVLIVTQYGECMVIWDWKSSQVLSVCQSFGA